MTSKKITIDIWSDIACPWCYVGEKYLNKAIELYKQTNPQTNIEIHFHAYMIDPGTKKGGEDYLEYNKRRWGGDGWVYELKERGSKIGCNFKNWKWWPNTFLGHCLITEGNKKGLGQNILNDIFYECYENGKNVSDRNVLNEIAKKYVIGNDWDSKVNQNSVVYDDDTGKEKYGIHGVPCFIINGKYRVEGANPPETFIKTFNKC